MPDDYRRVQANPEQFGGLIARGIQEAAAGQQRMGQGQAELGRGETDLGRQFGKVAANDAFNQANEQATKILHGDPNKKDANGNPDLGFDGLKGRAKLDARPAIEAQLDELISGARDSVTTLDQQLEFDTISRRYRALWGEEIGRQADAAAGPYFNSVWDAQTSQDHDGVARNSGNTPQEVEARKNHMADAIRTAQIQAAYNAGAILPNGEPDLSNPVVQEATDKATKKLIGTWTEAALLKDPTRADKILDDNKDRLGDDYPVLKEKVRAKVEAQRGIGLAAQGLVFAGEQHAWANPNLPIYGEIIANIPGGYSTPEGFVKMVTAESHGDPNAVSRTGAVGLTQFLHSTWGQYGDNRDIRDPVANLVAAQRYAIANRRILGAALHIDPAKVTDFQLWLAHNQDAKGAIKLLQNPTVPPARLGLGQAVAVNGGNPNAPASDCVNLKFKQYNNPRPFTDMSETAMTPSMMARAFQYIANNPNFNDREKAHAYAAVKLQLEVKEVQDEQTAKAKKERVDHAGDQYLVMAAKLGADRAALIAHAGVDPVFNDDPQMRVWTQRQLSSPPGEEGNGSAFNEARRRALLPAGNSNRITDMRQVWQMSQDGSLTPKGIGEMRSVLNDLDGKGANSADYQHVLQSVLNGAKSRLSFEGEFDIPGTRPQRSVKGEQIYNEKFTRWFFGELATKTTPEDRWKFINDDKTIQAKIDSLYPRNQRAADRVMDSAGAQSGPETLIPPAPQGVASETWNETMTMRPVVGGHILPSANWGGAINFLRANPTPENIRYFDQKFPASAARTSSTSSANKGRRRNA